MKPRAQKVLKKPSVRCLALQQIGRALQKLRLPPVRIPFLAVTHAMRDQVRAVRRVVLSATSRIRVPAARGWVHKHVRLIVQGAPRWETRVNGKKLLSGLEASDFDDMGPLDLLAAAEDPCLEASVRPWRLPKWPTAPRVTKLFKASTS